MFTFSQETKYSVNSKHLICIFQSNTSLHPTKNRYAVFVG